MKLRSLFAAALLLPTAACATIMHGSNQGLSLDSTPAGVAISVDGKPMGTTPAVVQLRRKDAHVVRLEMEGYRPFEMSLVKKTAGWAYGNLIFGSIVGVILDVTTGAMYKLEPETITPEMQTRRAMVGGRRVLEISVVMSADPSWQKIGQLTRE